MIPYNYCDVTVGKIAGRNIHKMGGLVVSLKLKGILRKCAYFIYLQHIYIISFNYSFTMYRKIFRSLHFAVSRTQHGRKKEPSVKTLRFTLLAEFFGELRIE